METIGKLGLSWDPETYRSGLDKVKGAEPPVGCGVTGPEAPKPLT